jgi:hypothetical protein
MDLDTGHLLAIARGGAQHMNLVAKARQLFSNGSQPKRAWS